MFVSKIFVFSGLHCHRAPKLMKINHLCTAREKGGGWGLGSYFSYNSYRASGARPRRPIQRRIFINPIHHACANPLGEQAPGA